MRATWACSTPSSHLTNQCIAWAVRCRSSWRHSFVSLVFEIQLRRTLDFNLHVHVHKREILIRFARNHRGSASPRFLCCDSNFNLVELKLSETRSKMNVISDCKSKFILKFPFRRFIIPIGNLILSPRTLYFGKCGLIDKQTNWLSFNQGKFKCKSHSEVDGECDSLFMWICYSCVRVYLSLRCTCLHVVVANLIWSRLLLAISP